MSGATGVKFSVPTVANGMVYVGTGGKPPSSNTTGLGTLVGYGLLNQGLGAPTNLVVQAASPSAVHLTWTRNSSSEGQMLVDAQRTARLLLRWFICQMARRATTT